MNVWLIFLETRLVPIWLGAFVFACFLFPSWGLNMASKIRPRRTKIRSNIQSDFEVALVSLNVANNLLGGDRQTTTNLKANIIESCKEGRYDIGQGEEAIIAIIGNIYC